MNLLQQSPAGRQPHARASMSDRRPLDARVSRAAGLLLALTSLMLIAFVAPAFGATFDPHLVISDDNMRATYSMSAADIQAFLASRPGILKSLVTPSHAAVLGGAPGPMQPASQIIFEAAQGANINPRVLLTMLQKEQSLIERAPAKGQYTLDWAVGMGCPDSGPRNVLYQGFGNQIWWAAQKLSGYGEVVGAYGYPWYPGKPVPGTVSGIGGFVPGNIATFKLYVYNPSIAGNTSFYNLYVGYFGDPFASPSLRPVYRFYNVKTLTHFYTVSDAERYTIQRIYSKVFRFEGAAFSINTSSTANVVPLYRFYNARGGTHFYTASESEKDMVLRTWPTVFRLEGVAWKVSTTPGSGPPVYRFYNVRTSAHFYTASDAERAAVNAKWPTIFHDEGIAYYLGN